MAGDEVSNRDSACASLQKRFPHTNTVQLFYIENAIHDCEQGASSVTAYFTKLKNLWDERDALCAFPACRCEAVAEVKTYQETQKTMKFLMGLGHGYATIGRNVIRMKPLPNINQAYIMALCHEIQNEDDIALKTYGVWPSYSTHSKKTEKEIKEMAKKVDDLCGIKESDQSPSQWDLFSDKQMMQEKAEKQPLQASRRKNLRNFFIRRRKR